MRSISYNKLVCHRISELIEEMCKTCKTENLSPKVYLRMLDSKLDEELAECHNVPAVQSVLLRYLEFDESC